MTPVISVVLPVYNGEKYLAKAIESVLNQTYTNFEFIIINDASTDNTAAIIYAYSHKDNRIKYVENKSNLRVVGSLNRGIELATGEFIARMDADDIALPTRFAAQVNFLNAHPDISMIDVLMEYIDENDAPLNQFNYRCFEPAAIRKKLANNNVLGHSSIMIRTAILKKHRYNVTWYEDYELWLRLTSNGHQIAKINKPLLLYRIHTQSITGIAVSDKSHFYKQGMAKATYLYSEIFHHFRLSKFNMRVSFYMIRDFLLYFYKRIKR